MTNLLNTLLEDITNANNSDLDLDLNYNDLATDLEAALEGTEVVIEKKEEVSLEEKIIAFVETCGRKLVNISNIKKEFGSVYSNDELDAAINTLFHKKHNAGWKFRWSVNVVEGEDNRHTPIKDSAKYGNRKKNDGSVVMIEVR